MKKLGEILTGIGTSMCLVGTLAMIAATLFLDGEAEKTVTTGITLWLAVALGTLVIGAIVATIAVIKRN